MRHALGTGHNSESEADSPISPKMIFWEIISKKGKRAQLIHKRGRECRERPHEGGKLAGPSHYLPVHQVFLAGPSLRVRYY